MTKPDRGSALKNTGKVPKPMIDIDNFKNLFKQVLEARFVADKYISFENVTGNA